MSELQSSWLSSITLKDLFDDFDDDADELEEIQRVRPQWIARIENIPALAHLGHGLTSVRTVNEFDKWLDRVYDFCDEARIWIK